MKWFNQSTEEVIKELETTSEGLTSSEANARLEKNGKNKLAEAKKVSIIARFFKQFANLMIIVLLAAAAVSAVISIIEHESFVDVFVILFVVIVNAILGTIQEAKAEKAIDALKEMTAAQCKVVRDGKMSFIRSEDLVVGDLIVLEAGDAVPADARIIEAASLKVEEAALTGESVPEEKHASVIDAEEVALGDRRNMLYMGGTVVYGRGKAIVTSVGMATEMGKIAGILSASENEETPLQIKLNQLSKVLTFMVLGICVIMFVVGIIRAGTINADVIVDTFMVAISLAVAAIPEGLAAVVTIVLSIGVTKMAKHNAVIRRLTAVETLGCTQIICSDKTGTLTQNKMTVVDYYGYNQELLAKGMALCSDAELDEANEAVGEPTECALVNYAYKLGLNKHELKEALPRVGEAPFDSLRKLMSTVHEANGEDYKYIQFTKGALEEVLNICKGYLDEDGSVKPITQEFRAQVLNKNKEMADNALRVLGLAYTTYKDSFDNDNLEHDLIYVGFVGMKDPIRVEVKDAIAKCQMAGIKVIMITGDHKDTAVAIAKELGIITDASQAIVGAELDKYSDEELIDLVEKYSVYVRVQPEHKVRIVQAWKAKDKVTAMTGDGVNDAPSIKSADIGVGMGITGTDVTKNVADMILADDNFATIVAAVEEGRKIYSNIRKAIQFLLSSNLSEVIAIFFATMCGFTILSPVQILWINLITDSLPALALGIGEEEKDAMSKEPRPKSEGLFANGLVIDVIVHGFLVALITVAAYLIGSYLENGVFSLQHSNNGMTMAFITMSLTEVFHAFNMRSQNGSIFTIKKQNMLLWLSALVAIALTLIVVYVPLIKVLFGFDSIAFSEYLICFGLGLSVIVIVEAIKLVKRLVKKAK
ncbi:MAG: calcium-translocating P-type ATPase, PMCA-type [Bacilli bacterium]|nr:calcium-translocating P-type ATPase, PMCA-type [Bacilli bacterium]